jgi:hypothetical protein
MNLVSVSNWLSKELNKSLAAKPATYPQSAVCGILYDYGFSNVHIEEDRPNYNILVKQSPTIFVNFVSVETTAMTTGGPFANKKRIYSLQLDFLWIADFLGTPVLDVDGNVISYTLPTYTDYHESVKYFRNFLSCFEKVYDNLTFIKTDANTRQNCNIPLTDVLTGSRSYIKEISPTTNLLIAGTELAENKKDFFYSARMDFTLTEITQN